jgi:hypothetical protein
VELEKGKPHAGGEKRAKLHRKPSQKKDESWGRGSKGSPEFKPQYRQKEGKEGRKEKKRKKIKKVRDGKIAVVL